MENTSTSAETPEWQGYYNTNPNFLSSDTTFTAPSEWDNSRGVDQNGDTSSYVYDDSSYTTSYYRADQQFPSDETTAGGGFSFGGAAFTDDGSGAGVAAGVGPVADAAAAAAAVTPVSSAPPAATGGSSTSAATTTYPPSYYNGSNPSGPYMPLPPLFYEFNSSTNQRQPMFNNYPANQPRSYIPPQNTASSAVPTAPCGTSPPVKRPRGRPRKHPLPINHPIEQPAQQQQQITTAAAAIIPNNTSLIETTEGLADVATVDRTSRAEKALRLRKELYSDAVIRELAKLDEHEHASTPDVAEEYHGYGGPFAVMEAAFNIQQLEEAAVTQQQSPPTIDSLIDSCRTYKSNGVHLNTTAMWASLNPRVPVRDLAVSRAHMAALLNDGTVYVYRHKTATLVRTRVSQWEKIESLSDVGVVSVRLASACLPANWREQYHQLKRRELVDKLRHQLKEDTDAANILQPSGSETTEEEIRLFIKKSPKGFLTLPYSRIDPDWLPDPVILASVDNNGIVRFSKCGGYYNYPILTRIDTNDKENNQPDDIDELIEIDGQQYKVTRNRTAMDRTDRQAELSVVKRVTSAQGQAGERVKAHVVDVALGEITMASLVGVHNAPELSMVLYAVAPDQELSAFVKGKGIYIRFKNFPTGPAKMHCGPLGHTGVVLLANGTVWQWNASTEEGNRIAVAINQVGGSLKGRAVVDLLGTGADYFALTGDGVVHEWNARKAYANTNHLLYSLDGHDKLDIPDPIEWTPKFKEDLIVQSGKAIRTLPPYAIGQFSWFLRETNNESSGQNTAVTQCESGCSPPGALGNTPPGNTPPGPKDTLEAELESKRQEEIQSRYVLNPVTQENMKVERLFVCDGISFLFRPATARRVHTELNDLGGWSVVSVTSEQWVKQSPMALRPKMGDGPYSASRQLSWTDACNAAHQARLFGKPLLTNPVIVARYRLTASGMKDQQLRSLLESMAASNPPCYRFITAPNYLVLAVLRTASINNLHRVCLTTRMPLMLVADDPSRYAESLFGNSILTPILSDILLGGSEGASDVGHRRNVRRGRGRVGRPRGSRAGTRASLSTRTTTTAITTTTDDDQNVQPEDNSTTDHRLGAAAGTRKRNRRFSLDDEEGGTDPTQWKQLLQYLDSDDDDDIDDGRQTRGKRSRRNNKKGQKIRDEPYQPPEEELPSVAH